MFYDESAVEFFDDNDGTASNFKRQISDNLF